MFWGNKIWKILGDALIAFIYLLNNKILIANILETSPYVGGILYVPNASMALPIVFMFFFHSLVSHNTPILLYLFFPSTLHSFVLNRPLDFINI
jgi:hypothetical protein